MLIVWVSFKVKDGDNNKNTKLMTFYIDHDKLLKT